MTGYEALRESAALIDLSQRGKIRVTGEDRARLLHAMSTNDVQHLTPGSGVYAFFLNDKGRILGDAFIYNFGEDILLDTEAETREKLQQHLDQYIIADDAYLEDETNRWAVIGLEGPQSITAATELGIAIPEQRYGVREWGGGFVTRAASSGVEGLRIFIPEQLKEDLVAKLEAAGIPQASGDEARTVRIENGIPRYGEDISERYLVQETQVTHAIHSNKGCYLGQEIVERVRSRGQVHRILVRIGIRTKTAAAAGTKLNAGENSVGEISSSVFSPALSEVAGLAYVRTEAAQAKPQLTVAGSEPPVTAYLR